MQHLCPVRQEWLEGGPFPVLQWCVHAGVRGNRGSLRGWRLPRDDVNGQHERRCLPGPPAVKAHDHRIDDVGHQGAVCTADSCTVVRAWDGDRWHGPVHAGADGGVRQHEGRAVLRSRRHMFRAGQGRRLLLLSSDGRPVLEGIQAPAALRAAEPAHGHVGRRLGGDGGHPGAGCGLVGKLVLRGLELRDIPRGGVVRRKDGAHDDPLESPGLGPEEHRRGSRDAGDLLRAGPSSGVLTGV
mmetsp:Transcript_73021/g.201506  ORF Transcript_73021/g.201506 Transcript_73021/m.201506 type:complete len:241 (+) Transcript_73021:468-1190(+)